MNKLSIFKRMFVSGVLIAVAAMSFAEIKMCGIFSDGMVLQRDMPVKIWGKAKPNARVGVEFAGQKKMVKASKTGDWKLLLDPMKANADGSQMSVFEDGKEGAKFEDVLVGEVWLLSGQSNMEWKTAKTTDFEAAKKRADYPTLRWFQMPAEAISQKSEFDCPNGSKWEPVSSANLGNTSGVGFYFAEKLMKDLGGNIPVGVVDTSLGGAAMRAYIPDEATAGIPFLEKMLAEFNGKKASYDYGKAIAAWRERCEAYEKSVAEAKAAGKPVPEKPWNVRIKPHQLTPLRAQNSPSYLYNAKIAPIAGFAMRGVLWYQGESDASGASLADFKPQFVRMIETWRKAWEQGDDLYFAWVQLASFTTSGKWAETRWQQYLTMKEVSKSGMANIIDCGEEKDIHPKDKTTVGTRLEGIVLKDVYGKKGFNPYGPMFKMVRYTPKGAEVIFDLGGRSLVGKGDSRGFEVKVNGEWKTAKADLVGKRVIVNLAEPVQGAQIEGVRYLWTNWALPQVWLFNDKGLPALSFIHEK